MKRQSIEEIDGTSRNLESPLKFSFPLLSTLSQRPIFPVAQENRLLVSTPHPLSNSFEEQYPASRLNLETERTADSNERSQVKGDNIAPVLPGIQYISGDLTPRSTMTNSMKKDVHNVNSEKQPQQLHDTLSIDSTTSFFELATEPATLQRKSYSYERRWIKPAPLIIQLKNGISCEERNEIMAKIASATVTPRLVTTEDIDVTANCLEGKFGSRFCTYPCCAKMFLKVKDTSNGSQYGLVFEVSFDSLSGRKTEIIRSKPFSVMASSREKTIDPIVTGIKPQRGSCNKEKEIWIKGSGFIGEVSVTFGSKPAKVLESFENLIVVLAPTSNCMTNEEVQVQVFNRFSESKQSVTYLYIRK